MLWFCLIIKYSKLDLSATFSFVFNREKTRSHMYQNVLPQFFFLRSISFGENLISFLMLITGRALGGRQKSVSNSMKMIRDVQ